MAHTGETVEFNCYSDSEVEWRLQRSSEVVDIIPMAETGQYENSTYYLRIKNVQHQHQGIYKCFTYIDYMIISGSGYLNIQGM